MIMLIRLCSFNLLDLSFHSYPFNCQIIQLDAIHNFKWVKIIQMSQNGRQQISNLAE